VIENKPGKSRKIGLKNFRLPIQDVTAGIVGGGMAAVSLLFAGVGICIALLLDCILCSNYFYLNTSSGFFPFNSYFFRDN